MLRIDDIPQPVADDIHAYGVIGTVVLYATKGKIKKVGQVKVNSLIIRGSTPHSNSDNSIPQKSGLSTDSSKKDLTDTKFDLADNDEAKIYDNKVLTIEELTVVERVGHQDAETSSDSTSSAVSSKYIIARFRELVKENKEKIKPNSTRRITTRHI